MTIELRDDEKWITRSTAAEYMTMWWTESKWLSFVESEYGDITGPGHINPRVFANSVNSFIQDTDPEQDLITSADVSHTWVKAAVNEYGEWRASVCDSSDPHAIAVTTIWNIR